MWMTKRCGLLPTERLRIIVYIRHFSPLSSEWSCTVATTFTTMPYCNTGYSFLRCCQTFYTEDNTTSANELTFSNAIMFTIDARIYRFASMKIALYKLRIRNNNQRDHSFYIIHLFFLDVK